jgi:uncharacterized protein YndB with AHSA1/START domain
MAKASLGIKISNLYLTQQISREFNLMRRIKMLKIIAIAVVVSIVAALIFAATRPDIFRVERSASIKAPPEKIFSLINDFHQWQAWSPWEKVDPAAKATFSGAANGVGAVYEWNGNKEVGQGRMEIIESSPPSKVVLKIDFIKPFDGHNTIEFTLAPHGDATTVTQAMYGPSPYISKIMCLFFSMDKMVGSKYEEGLAALKAIAEK